MTQTIVVMGVSGCGKSTVGAALADALGIQFVDGDGLHPAANVAKMSSGTPLTDEDRWPWLDKVGETLRNNAAGCVVACSALKRIYRDRITTSAGLPVFFAHLDVPRAMLEMRMQSRRGHFMPASLLDSQLATLEPLAADEFGMTANGALPLGDLVQTIERRLTVGTL